MKPNRVKRTLKAVIDEATEDRKLALEAYAYFKTMADENPQDSTAKGLMVDSLKLAQSSKASKIKMLELIVKMDLAQNKPTAKSKKEPENLYEELDNLANEE